MAFSISREGETQMLNLWLGKAASESLELRLFTNNITPAEADTAATYTEMSGLGYAKKTLVSGSWTVTANSGVTIAGAAKAVYPLQTFTLTAGAGATIYGYYIVGATSGLLYLSEVFSPIATIPSGGGTVTVTPVIEQD